MQFKVPQFLDIEDKIFGPFTFSQFVYLVGGAGLCFILYKLLGLLIGFIPIILVAGLAAALTFYRPNNKPLVNMLESGLKYVMQNKLYIWKKRVVKKSTQSGENSQKLKEAAALENARLDSGKLRDLAWSLDVLDLKNQEHQQKDESRK